MASRSSIGAGPVVVRDSPPGTGISAPGNADVREFGEEQTAIDGDAT